jgi:hypothetical protein
VDPLMGVIEAGQYSATVYDSAVDLVGNYYTVGTFTATNDFDPLNVHPEGNDTLTSSGTSDIFVAKYSPDYDLIWVRKAGGDNVVDFSNSQTNLQWDRGTSIDVDANGNVVIGGQFVTSATFGSIQISTQHASAYQDAFAAKLDADGNYLWVKSWGSTPADYVEDVAFDSTGRIVVAGYSNTSAVIKQFSPSGTALWSKTIASNNAWGTTTRSLAIDPSNNIIVSGEFNGKVYFNPDPSKSNNVTGVTSTTSSGNANPLNAYVVELNSSGSFKWVAPLIPKTTAAKITAPEVEADSTGAIYVAGNYNGQVDVNPASNATLYLSTTTTNPGYLLKLNASGSLNWAKAVGTNHWGNYLDLEIDPHGGVYMSGVYAGSFAAGGTMAPLSGAASRSSFLLHANSAGTVDWLMSLDGGASSSTNFITELAVSVEGSLYIEGQFSGASTTFYDETGTPFYELTNPGTGTRKFFAKLRRT